MDEKVGIQIVMPIIKEFVELIKDQCDTLEVGGSVRRQASFVKDVELVVIGGDQLRARLDKLVATRVIAKAMYGRDKTHRWGAKYRGLEYKDIRFEIFFTELHSWGYQYWLRTGPGDANEFVMSQMQWQNAPYRFGEGALRVGDRQVSVPTEEELFRLLGMPFIYPAMRSVGIYRRYITPAARWATLDSLTFVEADDKPKQNLLF